MASKPTERCLIYCRDRGWQPAVVEKWNPHVGIRQDLYGIIDIIALDEEQGVLGIQACPGGAVAAHLEKALEEKRLQRWLEKDNRFEIWGWRQIVAYRKNGKKAKRKRWDLRRVSVTLGDLLLALEQG